MRFSVDRENFISASWESTGEKKKKKKRRCYMRVMS